MVGVRVIIVNFPRLIIIYLDFMMSQLSHLKNKLSTNRQMMVMTKIINSFERSFNELYRANVFGSNPFNIQVLYNTSIAKMLNDIREA